MGLLAQIGKKEKLSGWMNRWQKHSEVDGGAGGVGYSDGSLVLWSQSVSGFVFKECHW